MQKPLTIAFDLDDTLIPSRKWKWYLRPFTSHPFRAGTFELLDYCKTQNFKIWVYTASIRPSWYIRLLFLRHGYHLDGVVNRQIHWLKVKTPSHKYPPSFGINVLVDDLESVYTEGKRLNYAVIRVNPNDLNWVETVKTGLQNMSIDE